MNRKLTYKNSRTAMEIIHSSALLLEEVTKALPINPVSKNGLSLGEALIITVKKQGYEPCWSNYHGYGKKYA